jgi:Ca2+/Na+ antiporter
MPVAPRRADMLAITFVISFLFVCGFYAYVFVHLEKERKRLAAHKKHLAEHLYEMRQEPTSNETSDRDAPDLPGGASVPMKPKSREILRRETMIQVSLAVGGLAAIFAGIALFNSLVSKLH